jgi:basic membrane lipoprotein Med (substrate-binding protein (PBP1-ABC) superfamily)
MREAARRDRSVLLVTVGSPIAEAAAEVSRQLPNARMLLIDGPVGLRASSTAAAVVVNRREQAFLAGYVAGLAIAGRREREDGAGAAVARQRPPRSAATALILEGSRTPSESVAASGFRLGLKAAHSDNEMRTIRLPHGASAEEIAEELRELTEDGVEVLLPLLYGARAAFARAVSESGTDVVWIDDTAGKATTNATLASVTVDIEATVRTEVLALAAGASAETQAEERPGEPRRIEANFASEALELYTDTDRFRGTFSESERGRISDMAARLRSGDLVLEMPSVEQQPEE